jgi:hypothetical protein
VGGQSHAPATLPSGKDPVPTVEEDRWASEAVWTGAGNLVPTGIRSPDRPAGSESLYRLSYPGSQYNAGKDIKNTLKTYNEFPPHICFSSLRQVFDPSAFNVGFLAVRVATEQVVLLLLGFPPVVSHSTADTYSFIAFCRRYEKPTGGRSTPRYTFLSPHHHRQDK